MPRLAGFAWTADDLAAALGATRSRDARGGWTDAFAMVRAQVLLAAHARGLLAIETAHDQEADEKSFRAAAAGARADGFSGMMASHPAQVLAINAAFAPSEDELAEARAVIAAFESADGEPMLGLDRRSIGQIELAQARRVLGLGDLGPADSRPRSPILRTA